MDGQPRIIHRTPVFLLAVAAVLLAAILGFWYVEQQSRTDGIQTLQTILANHNKNDGKDGCPNDGNAGKGNDNKGPGGGCKAHPPAGQYGNRGNACTHSGQGQPPFC